MTRDGGVLMWEVRAAPGRFAELVAFVEAHAHPSARVYCAGDPDATTPDGHDARVVVIDPAGMGVPDVPSELVARPPHQWAFDEVPRTR